MHKPPTSKTEKTFFADLVVYDNVVRKKIINISASLPYTRMYTICCPRIFVHFYLVHCARDDYPPPVRHFLLLRIHSKIRQSDEKTARMDACSAQVSVCRAHRSELCACVRMSPAGGRTFQLDSVHTIENYTQWCRIVRKCTVYNVVNGKCCKLIMVIWRLACFCV